MQKDHICSFGNHNMLACFILTCEFLEEFWDLSSSLILSPAGTSFPFSR